MTEAIYAESDLTPLQRASREQSQRRSQELAQMRELVLAQVREGGDGGVTLNAIIKDVERANGLRRGILFQIVLDLRDKGLVNISYPSRSVTLA